VKDTLYEMMNQDAAAEDRISSAASGDCKSDADTAWPTEDLSAAFAQVCDERRACTSTDDAIVGQAMTNRCRRGCGR
jgi:hypothetical protein